jgi:hypothetical protein
VKRIAAAGVAVATGGVLLATAAALLGERVAPVAPAGGCVVLFGVGMVQTARARAAVS